MWTETQNLDTVFSPTQMAFLCSAPRETFSALFLFFLFIISLVLAVIQECREHMAWIRKLFNARGASVKEKWMSFGRRKPGAECRLYTTYIVHILYVFKLYRYA
jgi:hypothetical protein